MIYLEPIGGLCNRMRAIDSLLSLCEEHNQDITIIWYKHKNVLNCSFTNLFAPLKSDKIKISFITINKYSLRKIGNIGIKLYKNKYFLSEHNIAGFISNSYLGYLSNSDDYITFNERQKNSYIKINNLIEPMLRSKQDFIFSSCYRFCDERTGSYSYFKPVDSILQHVNNKIREFNENTIGFHIRRTDNENSKKVSTDEKVFDRMHTILSHKPNSTFFVASDCEKTKEKLQKTFGDIILTNSISSYNRNSSKSIKQSLVDLLCLSKTKKIYGSYGSSFSEVASSMGKIELEIVE